MKKKHGKLYKGCIIFCVLGFFASIGNSETSASIVYLILAVLFGVLLKKSPYLADSKSQNSNAQSNTPDQHSSTPQTNDDYVPQYRDITYKCVSTLSTSVNNFIALDLETTGLSPEYDRIVEISAVYFKNQVPVDSFSTLVNPGIKIPRSTSQINHITNKMIQNAPNEYQVITKLMDFITSKDEFSGIFVAYNAKFDAKFLDATCHRLNIQCKYKFFDCYKLSQAVFTGLTNYKLTTVAESLGLSTSNSHRACVDAENCGKILIQAYKKLVSEKEKVKLLISSYDSEIIEQTKEILGIAPEDYAFSVSKGKDGYLRFYRNSELFLTYRKTKTLSYVLIDSTYCKHNDITADKASDSERGFKRYAINTLDDLIGISEYIKSEYKTTSKSCGISFDEMVDTYRTTVDY